MMKKVEVKGEHVVFYKLVSTGKDKKCEKNAIQAVLLCKRTQDAPVHPGYWSLFGGKRRSGEKLKETARREVEEELEVTCVNLKRLIMKKLHNVKIMRKQGTYLIRYFSSQLEVDMDNLRLKRNKKEDKVEGEGLGWFTAEEVHHLMMRPEDRIAVTKFFRKNGV